MPLRILSCEIVCTKLINIFEPPSFLRPCSHFIMEALWEDSPSFVNQTNPNRRTRRFVTISNMYKWSWTITTYFSIANMLIDVKPHKCTYVDPDSSFFCAVYNCMYLLCYLVCTGSELPITNEILQFIIHRYQKAQYVWRYKNREMDTKL